MPIVTGYKATDAEIRCRGFQFVPGEWHEVEGEIVLCGNGFHFCPQPSGPWAYYSEPNTRLWKIEAEDVLETQWEPGADRKCVARRIRLVEEIVPDGYGNTGHRNTGHRNTGDCNTGDRNTGHGNTGYGNTGHRNTGDCNTGHGNTGYGNTGYGNTGHRNTGHRNTGDYNTGDYNTGHRNTGDCNTGHGNTGYGNTGYGNTGDRNTGYGNTGYGNATDRSAGFFCAEAQTLPCFDVDSGLTYDQFRAQFGLLSDRLSLALLSGTAINFETYANLPNITPEKLLALHEKFVAARKEAK